jgi:glycoside/pentoside/hexuronide:cation symporter, GPH family
MNSNHHYVTKDIDRIPFIQKVNYGLGAFVNNLLGAAIGTMLIVLNLGLGMDPALVGLIGALPRLTDAITDPLMGFISDNTKSRWGRRRPYIFVGAILSAIIFAMLWQLPRGQTENFYFWYFLVGSFLFYLAYTIFATPWVALGYELTPDYHERTRLMGVQNFLGQFAYIVAPWFLFIMQHKGMFDDMIDGAAGLALMIAVAVVIIGVLPAIFLKERYKGIAEKEVFDEQNNKVIVKRDFPQDVKNFFIGFGITLKFKPFLKLCVATFLIFNGFMLIASFQSYVVIYYVFGGDIEKGAEYTGYVGTLGAVSTFAVITLVTWMSTRIGKRKSFFISIGISMIGYALKWFCYNPEAPWMILIPAPLLAFGLGGLFTLMPSMMADVVDYDELQTHQRREGMYGSIFWWVVKLGMAAALAASGFLLNATNFDVALAGAQSDHTLLLMRLFDIGIPLVASAIAIWTIYTYDITEEKAHEVRMQLEARRGAA